MIKYVKTVLNVVYFCTIMLKKGHFILMVPVSLNLSGHQNKCNNVPLYAVEDKHITEKNSNFGRKCVFLPVCL